MEGAQDFGTKQIANLDLPKDTWVCQVEEKEKDIGDMAITEVVGKEEAVPEVMGSEEMELHIAHLLDKIENFTQQVPLDHD
ncbi:hypothetical protein CRG98_010960 [Punica granatum]|uniref:Uncharacterized protein n=1 Tax=Punica granatum TaxID=22663 RepID=A0A2I0KK41_PUNGR|nr:hypothetical protein CRG98_010960 [Punica granatum]